MGLFLLFMAEKFAYESDTMGVLVAVLDSNFWLATHVTTITIGYAATLLAGMIGQIAILLDCFARKSSSNTHADFIRMIYGTISFATIFTFLGTVLGGFWADQSWGRFWGWDPKENGALVLLLWNAFLLHAKASGYIRYYGLVIGSVMGNIMVAAAWWGVNLLSIGLHSYGFSSGIRDRLLFFFALECIFLSLGFWIWIKNNKRDRKI